MFDQITPQPPASTPGSNLTPPPSSSAAEPVDILSSVDGGIPTPQPTSSAPSAGMTPAAVATRDVPVEYLVASGSRPWLKSALIAIVGLLIVGGGAYGGYRFVWLPYANAPSPATIDLTAEEDVSGQPSAGTTVPAPQVSPELLPPAAIPEPTPSPNLVADTDGDGLTGEVELQLGTDTTKPDTDGDGLFDGEEVNIFQTDPLRADTDGDTYDDGVEVKNGFNPKGEGRLFTVPPQ